MTDATFLNALALVGVFVTVALLCASTCARYNAGTKEFRRAFVVWFASFMALFIAANLAGFVLRGGKRYAIGFPCAIAEWIVIGEYRDSNFYPLSIFIDAVVCAAVSVILARLCVSPCSLQCAEETGAAG